MLKKTICCAITGIIMMSCLSGCGNPGDKPQGGVEVNTKTYNLPAISYMQSQTEKTYDDEFITVTIPTKDSFSVGEKIDVASKIKATKIWKRKDNEITAGAVYFVCDWGDGTWSYNGPGLQNDSTKSTVVNSHVYNQPGTYYISVAAFNMQTEEQIGWSEGKKIVIEGEQKQREGLLTELQPISSPSFGKSYNAEQVTDGDEKTYFKSTVAQEATEEQYVGYLFNDNYTLDHLEVQIPSDTEIFPCNIAIEYTSDYGKSWQSLPKYYYLYTNSEGIFTPLMNFPNPKGATLSLGLDGIVANGIRIVSKLTNVSLDMLAKDKYFTVSEMRVYGNRRTTFYTSLGNTFDADLNNMWTIFGSAKTEPNLTGNQLSSATNGSPFRTGHTIIGSTEWLQWNGLKFNWTDYDAAKSTYYNFLKNTRTGPDGWSQDDGYIWATANGQYHLDMGAHYTYNSIFILAARDYLMQQNNIGEFDEEGNLIEFMDMKNSSNQTMRSRLSKAMSYMLNTLDGKDGLLIINDPRNNALAGAGSAVASNYWDAMTSFGYISSYENIFFYGSLLAYADILEYYGEDASYYRTLAETVKQKFNDTFWDRSKKRYITSINANGVKLDFGVTYTNFMACAFGLADEVKTEAIYMWLDGERTIAGDTSTGEDIYGRFKYAARGNTLDVSKVKDPSGNYYWWYNDETMSPAFGLGAFGNQMQNGGTIFYISYYDLLGRLNRANGADDAFDRFSVIMEEFHKDSLRRNSRTRYGEYVEGIVGEFPESGLVPYTFLQGFMGINATNKGLEISPNLPSCMDYAGVSTYVYGNRTYSIRVDRSITEPVVEKYSNGIFYVQLPADATYYITADNRLIKG